MSAQLDLIVRRPIRDIEQALLADVATFHAALSRCADLSGLQDKSVAIETGIDAPTWSRIRDGSAGVRGDFLERLMDACGNELPLLWLLHRRGYDTASLRKRESELERQLREARETIATQAGELETIKNFVRETRGAA